MMAEVQDQRNALQADECWDANLMHVQIGNGQVDGRPTDAVIRTPFTASGV